MPKMPKIVASLRSIFIISAWKFRQITNNQIWLNVIQNGLNVSGSLTLFFPWEKTGCGTHLKPAWSAWKKQTACEPDWKGRPVWMSMRNMSIDPTTPEWSGLRKDGRKRKQLRAAGLVRGYRGSETCWTDADINLHPIRVLVLDLGRIRVSYNGWTIFPFIY